MKGNEWGATMAAGHNGPAGRKLRAGARMAAGRSGPPGGIRAKKKGGCEAAL